MVKFFKIKEKIVWVIATLAIVAVPAMIFIGAFANLGKVQFDRSSFMPSFYGAVAMVVFYKIVVLYYTSFYQTEIDEKTGMLASLDNEMKRFRVSLQEGSLPVAKFVAIMEALNKKLRNAEVKQFVYNIIRYKEKISQYQVIPPNCIWRMVQWKEKEHRQELLHAVQGFVGVKGWGGRGFDKYTKMGRLDERSDSSLN